MKNDTEVVSVLRSKLADELGRQRYELWFGHGTRLELNEGTLTIGVPNPFFQGWLRTNFREEIQRACVSALGNCPAVEFRVDSPQVGPRPDGAPRTASSANGHHPPEETAGAPSPSSPANGSEKPTSGSAHPAPRRRFAELASFVNGPSNRLARAAAEMVIERPGELSPLVIHGPTAVGKTHLLEAVCTGFRKSRPGTSVLYMSAEQFTTGFLQALRGSGLPSFRQKYRGVDLLVLDDLQFFCGKRHTQIELLYTIDTLSRNGRQMVFAADRSPEELTDLGPELCTRLQAGMVSRIEPADYEMRVGILGQMARRMSVNVPEGVKRFIASRLTDHARELSGALCRLQAASQAAGRPIDVAMAEEILAEMIRHSSRVVRLPDIEKAVCQAFGLEASTLHSSRKGKQVSQPRMLAMWLARKYTRAALCEIGQFFGRRSHSTVVSAQKRVEGWLESGVQIELADKVWKADEAIRQVERCLVAG